MTPVLPCLRCGEEGPDVRAKLVDLEAEAKADGARIRDVEVTTEIHHRHVTERHKSVVPERWGTEWRCRDKAACDRRYREMTQPMAVPTPPTLDEEVPPWM